MTNKGAVARSIEMNAQAQLRAKDQKIAELEISLGRALKKIDALEAELAAAKTTTRLEPEEDDEG